MTRSAPVRAAVGAVLFFGAAPGIVAGGVPWLLTGWVAAEPLPFWIVARVAGVALLVPAVAVLVHAFVRFVREGRGTPAPVAPTEHLVVGGIYRHVRNPMYVAVLAIILGQALLLGRAVLVGYAVVVWAAVAAFVRWYEEPTLLRQFGTSYAEYRRAVPGWLPRLRPWSPGDDRAE